MRQPTTVTNSSKAGSSFVVGSLRLRDASGIVKVCFFNSQAPLVMTVAVGDSVELVGPAIRKTKTGILELCIDKPFQKMLRLPPERAIAGVNIRAPFGYPVITPIAKLCPAMAGR